MQKELVRKCVHLSIACVPAIDRAAAWLSLILLSCGIIIYVFSESLRVEQGRLQDCGIIRIIQRVTLFVSRAHEPRDIVLAPVTLALGAIFVLLFFPPPYSYAGIYCLAFGDTAAILVGKLVKGPRLPLSGEKRWSGQLACWGVCFFVCWLTTGLLAASLAAGFAASVIESLQIRDGDNLMIPMAAALFLEVGASLF